MSINFNKLKHYSETSLYNWKLKFQRRNLEKTLLFIYRKLLFVPQFYVYSSINFINIVYFLFQSSNFLVKDLICKFVFRSVSKMNSNNIFPSTKYFLEIQLVPLLARIYNIECDTQISHLPISVKMKPWGSSCRFCAWPVNIFKIFL